MKRTIAIFFGLWAGIFAVLSLDRIPAPADVLDLHRLSEALFLLLVLPIRLFDLVTGGRFVPHGDGSFIVFPSGPQAAFCLIFDIAAVAFIARFIALRTGRK